jgi:membrane-bound ClpP family serine protease
MMMMAQIKLYATLAVLVGLMGALAWFANHERTVERDKIEKRQAAAVTAAFQAAAEEVAKHAKIDTETIGGLQADLARTLVAAADPVPVVRLCHPAGGASPVPEARPAAGSVPQLQSAAAGHVPAMPDGTGAGPDIGPGLQHLADACEVISARERAILRWARGLSETGPPP